MLILLIVDDIGINGDVKLKLHRLDIDDLAYKFEKFCIDDDVQNSYEMNK